jgi:hypothetical protein
MTVGLQSVAWSGATGFRLLFDTTTVPATSVTLPDYEVKVEKVRRLGEMLPTKRTVGAAEISVLKVIVEAADYTAIILPRMPQHGGTLIEFVCTCTINHPSVTGSLGLLLDGCRIVKHPGITIEPDEKAIKKELEIDVMAMWEKGLDGKWKALSSVPTMPSSQAKAAMTF